MITKIKNRLYRLLCHKGGHSWSQWTTEDAINRFTTERICKRCGETERYPVVDHICPDCGKPAALLLHIDKTKTQWKCRNCCPNGEKRDDWFRLIGNALKLHQRSKHKLQ